jgi:carbonic anhydrase
MSDLKHLIDANLRWAQTTRASNPNFFKELSRQQSPKYLWIGCSDSRVPANQIVGLAPGEIFVHRNVANIVAHGDLNCLSVIQFATDVLKIEHIIVVGHYGCGGVQAAMNGDRHGLVDNWLRYVGDIRDKHQNMLDCIDTSSLRHAKLCELNVIEQALNVCQSTVVQDAWARGQPLTVHSWVYSLLDGRINDLRFSCEAGSDVRAAYDRAIARLCGTESSP